MSGDPFKRVQSGDPFAPTATAWNGMLDAAEAVRNEQTGFHVPPRLERRDAGIVLVVNTGSTTIPRYGIVVPCGANIADPSNLDEPPESLLLRVGGGDPAYGSEWIITQESIPAGDTGLAMCNGATWVRLDVTEENQNMRFADPVRGTHRLEPSVFGAAQILWKSGSPIPDVAWGIVRLGIPSEIMVAGTAEASIAKGSSGTVNFADGDPPSSAIAKAELAAVEAGQLCYVQRRLRFNESSGITSILVIVNAECE